MIKSGAIILSLDNVTDPHNLGACSVQMLLARSVVVPKDKSAQITPTVGKGLAQSTTFRWWLSNLARALRIAKARVWVIGTAGEAEKSLYR